MKQLCPFKNSRNFLAHLAHSAVAGVVMLVGSVQAEDVLITPTAVTAQSGLGNREAIHAIDGSGMSPNSPVTTSSTCTKGADGVAWLSNNQLSTWITFDLGSVQTITGFHLWNYNEGANASTRLRSIKDCGIYAGTNLLANNSAYASAGAAWGTLVTNMTLTCAPGANGYTGEDYTFTTPVTTRYLQIYVLNNYGSEGYTGISEIRFRSPLTPHAIITSFGPGATIGEVVNNAAAIAWQVPYGSDVTTLAPSFTISDGATIYDANPASGGNVITSGTPRNFTNPVHYWVKSSDGAITNDYTVTVIVKPDDPVMINLAYMNSMDGTYSWQQTGTASQAAPLAYSGTTWNDGGNGSTAVSNLKKSNGVSTGISVSAVLRPRATGVDFGSHLGGNKLASYPTGLVLGSMFANDSAIKSGFVDVLTFSGLAATHSYNIVLVDPWESSVTFKYLSQSAAISTSLSINDWVSGKNYALLSNCIPNASGEITIQEKVSHDWSALCGWQIRDNGVRALNSEALIYTFTFPGAGAVTIAGTNISLTVPYGTPVTALAPTYTASPFATCAPASGSTHDFSSPVHYIIQSEDTHTTTDYTVTVNVTPISTAKDILTFGPGAVISGTNIVWTVPYATDLTSLTPAFTVSTFASGSPASSSRRNFTTPQTYTVTAQDHSTKVYTVTIAVAPPSSAKNILTFGLPGNSASIDQGTRTINWSVPYGTDLATLAPAYTVTQFASGSPASGVAPNFAANNPATYTLTAQDGSTQTYSVQVTVLPEMPTAINVNFAGGANPGNAWINGIQSSDAGARGSASRVAPATYSGNVWNDFAAAGSNSASLLDSRGALTGIGLTTTMQNGPGNTWTGLGTNRMLVSGLTSAYTGYTGIIALTGLNPAHAYNLYIASLHNTTAPTSTFRVGAVEKALTFTAVTDWTDGKTHVQFTGLIPATDGTLTVEGKSTGELVLNGFQLVDTTPQNDITSFTFPTCGAATIAGTSISIAVPYGTNLTALAPTYTLSYGATCVPASGSSQNFTSPVHYLVRASDNSTKDYTVTVTPRAIPDPQFTLTAPASWDGRQTITVQSTITNWALLAANGGTNVNYNWSVAGVAVTKQIAAGTLTLTRAQGNGPLTVTLVMDNGGWAVTHAVTINVQQPASDAWVYRTPAATEKPVDGQFFARDDTGFGRIYYNGTQAGATDVFLRLYTTANGVETLTSTTRQTLTNNSYAFTVPIAAGLYKYRVEFGTTSGGTDTVTGTVSNLICGDAYIIEGQSNAEAGLPNNGTPPEEDYYTSEWIRSYGNVMAGGTPCTWGTAVRARKWGSSINGQLQIGDWGIDLAKQLLEKYNMPICIINGALGGTRIDEHLRNEANHEDSATIYGRLLTRIEAAKLTHGIRGVFWHQGEQDQGRGGPYGGDFDYKWYQQNFVDLSAAWKQDYPNLRNYYIYQIWPAACGDTSANDMLRETQRTLPYLYSNMRIMSTLGVEPGSGCHFDLDGYQMFAELLRPMVELDNYGRVPDATETFTPPDLQRAWFTDPSHYEIALEFDQDMDGFSASDAKGHFYLDGVAGLVSSVSTSGKVIKLQLSAASAAQTMTYLKGAGWDGNQAKLLRSARGLEIIGIDINGNNKSTRTVTIAALTFANVPIQSATITTPDTFASWISGYYATPGDPKAAADADPDGDGLKNSVEYVLGTRPDTGNQGGPLASNVGANFVFTFQRALASKNAYTKVVIEVGTDLGTWPASYDVDAAPQVAISTGLDADHETVTLTLPIAPDTTKFARLKVITTAP
ncbi:MAG: sialate O-acetylesterase [Verrucomicrobiota bacterium]